MKPVTGSPGSLAVISALMRNQMPVRRKDPSRVKRESALTPAQQEFVEEKRKLAAEARRERRQAKSVRDDRKRPTVD